MANKDKARRQQYWVLLAAVAIILSSVSSTLYFTGFIGGDGGGDGDGSGYHSVSFTDAYVECDGYTRERYASRMRTLTLDDHSSRYEAGSNLYKIFLDLEMRKPARSPQPEPYWVVCFVSGNSGKITHYQVGEDKNAPVEAVRREPGGTIGWPL